MMSGEAKQMPRYQSIQKVRALEIKEIKFPSIPGPSSDIEITFVDSSAAPISVAYEWYVAQRPRVAGYLIVHDDGDVSFLSERVFEKTFVLMNDADLIPTIIEPEKTPEQKLQEQRSAWNAQAIVDIEAALKRSGGDVVQLVEVEYILSTKPY